MGDERRNRAEECRVDAESVSDPQAKRTLLEIAAVYDRLADGTETRLGIQSRLKGELESDRRGKEKEEGP
jgi:hypothetical protein